MCGRFAVGDTDGTDWADWLVLDPDLGWPPESWPTANWNIAPTQQVGIVLQGPNGRRAGPARWGLIPHWWGKPLAEFKATTFNARSEEAAGKPMFRDAWAKRRCLIPAIGWYEWSGAKGEKVPWFITIRRNTPGFWFAGLWSTTRIGQDRIVSATILTTAAGEATRHLHPRTPVVLEEDAAAAWLADADPGLMAAPPDDRVDLWPVDGAVGRVANNGPELIERVGLDV
ncbi:MAG: SOS response-associated peptidase [Pseudomonadota bacterium]